MIIEAIKENTDQIVQNLADGEIMILPTDTLYALSCDATNYEAVGKIFRHKDREREKALPVFFYCIEQIREVCQLNDLALTFAENFWPGALTLVLPLKINQNTIVENVYNKGRNLAVRIPDSKFIQEIIAKLGRPIVATSANISGRNPIKTQVEALEAFGKNIVMITGKTKQRPSTIVKIINDDSYDLIREGVIPREKIDQIVSQAAD